MNRKLLDEYLDGDLGAEQRAEMERSIVADAEVARNLAYVKSERALRAAAIASFAPAAHDVQNLAEKTLRAMHNSASHDSSPVGYVGIWLRRGISVAAAIAVVIGSFALGRISTTQGNAGVATVIPAKTNSAVVYRVVYIADTGDKEVREFTSLDEQNTFVNKLDFSRAQPQIATADLSSPGSF